MSLESLLATARARQLVSTTMSTAQARTLPADIRAGSLWSARTNHLGYVKKIAEVLDRVLAGEINEATARNDLQAELELLEYSPEEGFPDQPDSAEIPPAEADSLTDLSSATRINLMLRTQEELAFGRGQQQAGATRMRSWPAWELVRTATSRVPRDWPRRWAEAAAEVEWTGVATGTERMIARKDSPMWAALGSSEIFDDALDTDHPPFAFNSGMGWRELSAGDIRGFTFGTSDTIAPVPPAARPMNEGRTVSAKKIPADLLEVAKRDLSSELKGDELRYQESLDKVRADYITRTQASNPRQAERLAEFERRRAEGAARRAAQEATP